MSKARNTNVSVRAFANAWRRRFGAKSDSTRRALAEMADAFASRSEKTERGLRTWEDVWGSTSGRCRQATLSPALLRAFEPLLSARPELRTSPCDALNVEPERTFNAFCFLMQTYVAQSIVAVLERYYELSESELSAIFGESPFDWAKSVRKTLRVGDDDLKTLQFEKFARENDPFAETYAKFFSFELRKTLGEFYTPAPLAKYLTRRALELSDATDPTILDPTCGAGVFLTTALRRFLDAGIAPVDALGRLAGFDANALAVITARANLLVAATSRASGEDRKTLLREILDARRDAAPNEPAARVLFFDALAERAPGGPDADEFGLDVWKWRQSESAARRFDVILGNPPWIAWDKLSESYRDATTSLWRRYGLFDLSGKDAQYGGSKKELASLVVYATIDNRLKDGGVFGFVLPKSLFQTGKAGAGFRRFGEQTGAPFAALEIDDLSELDLFSNVASKASALLGRKGARTEYPIPLRRWQARKKDALEPFDADVLEGRAAPLTSAPGAPLLFELDARGASRAPEQDELARRQDELVRALFDRVDANAPRYAARLGANAAGASGVFWLESDDPLDKPLVNVRNLHDSGKRKVERVEAALETALLFPLVRWRDVDEYRVKPVSTLMLIPQDPKTRKGFSEETMAALYPNALAYLRRFELTLRARAAYRRYQNRAPFWSLYNVSVETFALHKVVWRRMDSTMRAAVAAFDPATNKPLVPQETLSTVAVNSLQEADYLCAVLNSGPVRALVGASCLAGSKSFGAPSALDAAPIPVFDPNDPVCQELARIGETRRKG